MAQTDERVKFKRGKSSTIPTAKEAGTLLIETDTGNAYVDDTDTNRVQLTDTRKLSLSGGTMTGDIDMGDNNITTSHTPKNGEDVINKDYFDANTVNYTAENPISIENDVIKHASFSERSGGPTSSQTLNFGDTFKVPSIKSDSHGHVNDIEEATMTMPDIPESVDHSDNASSADEATKLSDARIIDGVSFDGTKDIVHYGVCDTSSNTQSKVVELDDFKLVEGSEIDVKFSHTNLLADITLNVNSTGDIIITYEGEALTEDTADYIKENRVYRFVYDGESYTIVGDIDTDTDTTYTAKEPIELTEDNVIEHKSYNEFSGGPETNEELGYSSSFVVPYIQSDEYGHVSSIINRTLTLPDGTSTDTSDATEMILTNTARAFIMDQDGNVILQDDDVGIIVEWPICPDTITNEEIDALFD